MAIKGINPVYYKNTTATILPDVMYKAPYEEIEKGYQYEAQTAANNFKSLNILEQSLNQTVLPEDEEELQTINNSYRKEIDALTNDVNGGKLSSSQTQLRFKDLSRKIYDDMMYGKKSVLGMKANTFVNFSASNKAVAESNPALYNAAMETLKAEFKKYDLKKDDLLKYNTFKLQDRPDFGITNEAKIAETLQKLFTHVEDKLTGEGFTFTKQDGTKITVQQYINSISSTDHDSKELQILKDALEGFLKLHPEYYSHLTTHGFLKDGQIKDGKLLDSGSVWDKGHVYNEQATTLFNLIRQTSNKLSENPFVKYADDVREAIGGDSGSRNPTNPIPPPPPQPQPRFYDVNLEYTSTNNPRISNTGIHFSGDTANPATYGFTTVAFDMIREGFIRNMDAFNNWSVILSNGRYITNYPEGTSDGSVIENFHNGLLSAIENTPLEFKADGNFTDKTIQKIIENAGQYNRGMDRTWFGRLFSKDSRIANEIKKVYIEEANKIAQELWQYKQVNDNVLNTQSQIPINPTKKDGFSHGDHLFAYMKSQSQAFNVSYTEDGVSKTIPFKTFLETKTKGEIVETTDETTGLPKKVTLPGTVRQDISITGLVDSGNALREYIISYKIGQNVHEARISLNVDDKDVGTIFSTLATIDTENANLGIHSEHALDAANIGYAYFKYYVDKGFITESRTQIKDIYKESDYSPEKENDPLDDKYYKYKNPHKYNFYRSGQVIKFNETQLKNMGFDDEGTILDIIGDIYYYDPQTKTISSSDFPPVTLTNFYQHYKDINDKVDINGKTTKVQIANLPNAKELAESTNPLVSCIFKGTNIHYDSAKRQDTSFDDCSSYVAAIWNLTENGYYWNTEMFLSPYRKSDKIGLAQQIVSYQNNADGILDRDIIIYYHPDRPKQRHTLQVCNVNGVLNIYELGDGSEKVTQCNPKKLFNILFQRGYIVNRCRPNKDFHPDPTSYESRKTKQEQKQQ